MKLTKAQIVSDIIDRTGVYDPDMGYIIETKDGDVLDNTECSKNQLRNAVAIEDWNYEDNQIWGKFSELNNEAIV